MTELYCEICECDGEEIRDYAGINVCKGCFCSRPDADGDGYTEFSLLPEAKPTASQDPEEQKAARGDYLRDTAIDAELEGR